MIWVFPVAPCSRFLFGFRVLVPVNSPTCGREKPLSSFTFPSTQHKKRSNDAFRITQHSGMFRPVHTGINYIFEVLCALRPGGVGSLTPTLRLWCRSGVFHRRVAPPRRPIRARPSSWSSFPQLYAFQAVPLSRVGRQPTLSTWYTLRHSLHVLWPRAGSSFAAILVLYIHLSLYVIYASSSSLSSGAAWWIPGGDNGQDEVHHRQGVPYRQSCPRDHQRHPRRGASAPRFFL